MKDNQPLLPLFRIDPKSANFSFMIELLKGTGWRTAADLLKAIGAPDNDTNRRSLRALAEASGGLIAGGQQGYKLVEEMTAEEYNRYRNWMKSQADRMTGRILASDKVFYRRQPIAAGNGIL